MKSRNFRDLIVWQKSKDLVVKIYQNTASFPKEELFGIVSQMRRAAVSIPTNIAEGQGRNGKNEFKHFLGISKGSIAELETLIEISHDLYFLPEEIYRERINDCIELNKLLSGLTASLNSN